MHPTVEGDKISLMDQFMTCMCRKNLKHRRVQNHFQQDMNVTRKFENYGIVASTYRRAPDVQ
jgi:hypothetical protein